MKTLLTDMTWIEWAVVVWATAVCLLGAGLPMLGNLLGRLFLGEDPLLERWKLARQARRQTAVATRQAKRDAKKGRKQQLKAQEPSAR